MFWTGTISCCLVQNWTDVNFLFSWSAWQFWDFHYGDNSLLNIFMNSYIILIWFEWCCDNWGFVFFLFISIYSWVVPLYNPLTPAAVSKPLEMIGRSTYFLACSEATAPDSDKQTAVRLGWSSEYVKKSMHACCSVSAACRPVETCRRRGEIGGIPMVNSLGSNSTQCNGR